ncbi:MAG: hypothetical protein QM703_08545 [Gemmatales bacterium]
MARTPYSWKPGKRPTKRVEGVHAHLVPIIVRKIRAFGTQRAFCMAHNFSYPWLSKAIKYKCFNERYGFNGLARLLQILEIPVSENHLYYWNWDKIFEKEAEYRILAYGEKSAA